MKVHKHKKARQTQIKKKKKTTPSSRITIIIKNFTLNTLKHTRIDIVKQRKPIPSPTKKKNPIDKGTVFENSIKGYF